MEGIVNIEKKPEDIERCKVLVQAIIDEDMDEEMLIALTKELMTLCVEIGGDYSDDNIKHFASLYKTDGGLRRFKNKYGQQ